MNLYELDKYLFLFYLCTKIEDGLRLNIAQIGYAVFGSVFALRHLCIIRNL